MELHRLISFVVRPRYSRFKRSPVGSGTMTALMARDLQRARIIV
jgi:hypothetical protein